MGFTERRSWALAAAYAVFIIFIGYLDYITGFIPDFTVFYLAPIVLIALQFGFPAALALAFLAFLVDLVSVMTVIGSATSINAYLDGFLHFIVFSTAAYAARRTKDDFLKITELQRRLNDDLEIAKVAQKSMFKQQDPQIPGFDVSVELAFPQAVGGDFYDIMPLGKTKYGLVIADIAGKGLAAALFTAVLKENLRDALKGEPDPLRVVQALNKRLLDELPSEMFVTLFCGVLDIETGTLEFANAGHEPGILFTSGFAPALLTGPEKMILGVSDEPPVSKQQVICEPGSTLLLYTDGLIDPPAAGFDWENIAELLTDNRDAPAQATAQALYAARAAADPPPTDDITIICVKRGWR